MARSPLCEAIIYIRDEQEDKVLTTPHGHDCKLWTHRTTSEFIQEIQADGGVWGPMNAAWYPYHQVVKVEFKTTWVEA